MPCTSQLYETFIYNEANFYQDNFFFISFEAIEKIF